MKYYSDWKFIQWQSVELVANNGIARVVGLVPLVGYLILFNDEIAGIASFDVLAGSRNEDISPFILSSLAKMRLVFFGSLFVFFSNVIFRIFRPKELDQSKGDLEFALRVRDCYSVHDIAEMEADISAIEWKSRLSIFWEVLGEVRSGKPLVSGFRPDVRETMFSKHGDYIHFLAREWWVGRMHTFRIARVASLTLGVAGFLLLAFPTIDITQAVLRDILADF